MASSHPKSTRVRPRRDVATAPCSLRRRSPTWPDVARGTERAAWMPDPSRKWQTVASRSRFPLAPRGPLASPPHPACWASQASIVAASPVGATSGEPALPAPPRLPSRPAPMGKPTPHSSTAQGWLHSSRASSGLRSHRGRTWARMMTGAKGGSARATMAAKDGRRMGPRGRLPERRPPARGDAATGARARPVRGSRRKVKARQGRDPRGDAGRTSPRRSRPRGWGRGSGGVAQSPALRRGRRDRRGRPGWRRRGGRGRRGPLAGCATGRRRAARGEGAPRRSRPRWGARAACGRPAAGARQGRRGAGPWS